MFLKESTLGHLADMICGDIPNFRYRSSSYLTRFFHGLDLDYTHDGSTRRGWVLSVLEKLNNNECASDFLPSKDIIAVIENLVAPEYYSDDFPGVNKDLALKKLNEVIKRYQLRVELDSVTENPKLVSFSENFISTEVKKTEYTKVVTFSPAVFNIPNVDQNDKLVALMIPFSNEFNAVTGSIKKVCEQSGLICERADDLWKNSTVIQDIFELIYTSKIVIADFSGRNPNVMYEIGIAHTLGKVVIPITQSTEDIPFDIRHHRVLKYLLNSEGLLDLESKLLRRLETIMGKTKSDSIEKMFEF